jgi:hypothetical protein
MQKSAELCALTVKRQRDLVIEAPAQGLARWVERRGGGQVVRFKPRLHALRIAVLPPRLIHDHRNAVGQIQAALTRAHRQTDALRSDE